MAKYVSCGVVKVTGRVYKLNYRGHNYIINNISCIVDILLHGELHAIYIHPLLTTDNEYIAKFH